MHDLTLATLYTTMAVAMATDASHMTLAGLYLILGLTCWIMGRR